MQDFTFELQDLADFRFLKCRNDMSDEILDRPFDAPDEPEILDLADSGKRFVNYLIDAFIARVLAGGSMVLFESIFMEGGEVSTEIEVLEFVLIYFVMFAYYTFMEGGLNGKTLGKYVTRTRAITQDGYPLDWNKAALRSLCRLIPFEPFSFLFDKGWHDTISKTVVINDRKH
jgi:uncharacterized RDD family membrane protein YckC